MQTTVEAAHDALVAHSEQAHDAEQCLVCLRTGSETAHEEVAVAAKESYSAEEHFAILSVECEKAEAAAKASVETLEAEKADLASKVDVLEAEKASLTEALEAEKAAFTQFKSDLEAAAEKARLVEERAAAVKDANASLPETYFTPEKAERWAEMSAEAFETLVDGIRESAAAATRTATAEQASDGDGADEGTTETAAFRGGSAAGATKATGSNARRFLSGHVA